ncbi:hypothetical protein PSCICM_25240 [Pseudomonas cichorii]|nr:hypothetical protein PSCICM_25240 [Pseudomonas cichorii]
MLQRHDGFGVIKNPFDLQDDFHDLFGQIRFTFEPGGMKAADRGDNINIRFCPAYTGQKFALYCNFHTVFQNAA